MKESLGLIPSPAGPHYQLADYLQPAVLPTLIDYSPRSTPVLWQMGQPECAGFTTEKLLGWHNWGEYPTHLSPQWAYKLGKDRDGYPNVKGTSFWAIFQGCRQEGVCLEEDWPWENRWPPRAQPGPQAVSNAAKFRIDTYAQVSRYEIHAALHQFGPLALGINVYESIDQTGRDGIILPPTGALLGGHGLPIFLSDLSDNISPGGVIGGPNSWSKGWGKDGWFFIPYRYLISMFIEAWSLVDMKQVQSDWRWPDLVDMDPSDDDKLSIDKAWQKGAMHGYPGDPPLFQPTWNLRKRHVGIILQNLGHITENPWEDDWSKAKRGWVRAQWPELPFREIDRDDEVLTRYQMLLVVGRLLRGVT